MRHLYLLGPSLKRIAVVDAYQSLIWTERFSDLGDWELKVPSTLANRARFVKGQMYVIDESDRVMVLETINSDTDEEGRKVLTLKGRSLEMVLAERIFQHSLAMASLLTQDGWYKVATPGEMARAFFNSICYYGHLDALDIIPNLQSGVMYAPGNIAESDDVLVYEGDYNTSGVLLDKIKAITDKYTMGFRLTRDGDTGNLYFDIYTGNDRTSVQTVLPAVLFSPDMDNLSNIREVSSLEPYKTVAYVESPLGNATVYADGVSETDNSGFDRKVLLVDASNFTEVGDPADIPLLLTQRGKDALSEHKRLAALDGELSKNSPYVYGTDYDLGDLIEIRNEDGVTSNMRVVEQIFVSDELGDRAYPALATDLFITPGSWLDLIYNREWDDFTTEVWGDQ